LSSRVRGDTIARVSLPRVSFTVWSDVLCPWCQNAAVVLERVREDLGDEIDLDLVWKSYLLRPRPEPKPMDRFRRYTETWLRPAGAPDAGEFRVWATDDAPPSHSVPPAVAVKASARQGAFARYHRALMHAYFARNLDVTSRSRILEVAAECGLDLESFARDLDDPSLAEQILADHHEAVELGISGVPCVVVAGGFQMPGAQERAVYVNIVRRLLARQENP
jgi:predicted DsbA family dithiol-disulfide isomerase